MQTRESLLMDANNPKAAAGDGDAQKSFIVHWEASRSAVLSLVTAAVVRYHDVQDVVQETAFAASKAFANYDPSRPFLPWVLGVARNQILKYQHRASRDGLVLLSEESLQAAERVIVSMADRIDPKFEALHHCLKHEQGQRREVILLRYTENLSVTQIANQLDMTKDAVAALLYRARQSLAACIEQRLEATGGEA